MTASELLDSLGSLLGARIKEQTEFRGETTIVIDRRDLRELAQSCRDDLSFDYLLDITSVDNFGNEPRFEVVYELYSLKLRVHLRLKLSLSEDDPTVDTISDIWPTANWHEREIWDMMGLRFNGHPDLRPYPHVGKVIPTFPCAKSSPSPASPAMCRMSASPSIAPDGGRTVCYTAQRRNPRKIVEPTNSRMRADAP